MVVTATGMNTEWGRIMAVTSEDNDEETPLQERLNAVAEGIGKIGTAVAIIVFVVLFVRNVTGGGLSPALLRGQTPISSPAYLALAGSLCCLAGRTRSQASSTRPLSTPRSCLPRFSRTTCPPCALCRCSDNRRASILVVSGRTCNALPHPISFLPRAAAGGDKWYRDLIGAFIVGVTIIVVAVPEGGHWTRPAPPAPVPELEPAARSRACRGEASACWRRTARLRLRKGFCACRRRAARSGAPRIAPCRENQALQREDRGRADGSARLQGCHWR